MIKKFNTPRLRFPGFTDEWEQRKLDDVFEIIDGDRGKNYPGTGDFLSNGDVLFLDTGNVRKDGFNFNNRRYIDFNRDKLLRNGRLILGDYVLTSRGTLGNLAYYSQSVYDRYPQVRINSAMLILRVMNTIKVNNLYLYITLRSNVINEFMKHNFVGSAQPHITKKEFSSVLLPIPRQLEEQKMIGDFFDRFEKVITLHQRKLNHLILKKKSLLQKLFPINGNPYPEIRFPGFNDAWEQRKLDDIAKIKTGGGTPKTANPEYWSGNIPWIQSSDLVEGDIVHVNINKFINNNALKNSAARLISRDSIALVTRVGVGKVAVINQDFTTSQDFLSLSDFDGNDIKFLAYQLYRLMQENAKVLQGTSIKGITKTELIEQSISIPSSGQEQNLIANVLSKIDSIITLHQRKLNHLKLQKKALLQQLFV